MPYTTLRGEFVIRYPDLPRGGPEPDGDTVKFTPDSPRLVEGLPRVSGTGPDLSPRGVSVRLEGIDALETHFSDTHQELLGADAARDHLLAALGFTDVEFWPDLPNKIRSAAADRLRGHVLSNGIDANGRVIGFVYPGDPDTPDGTQVFVDDTLAAASANAGLLAAGLAYPAFYSTLPASLRTGFAGLSRAARAATPPTGIWPRATADPDGPATVTGPDDLEQLVIWPKLFRRIVPYLAAGYPDFDGFDAWLRADPVNRDDALFLLDRLDRGNLHDVVHAEGDTIMLTVWPEDFVITPDPAPVGSLPSPTPVAGDVLIVAALPNPLGVDAGHETVTLLNVGAAPYDLDGWSLADSAGRRHRLSMTLAAGGVLTETVGTIQLANAGSTLTLLDRGGVVVDQVSYTGHQVRPGRSICFGR